MKRGKKKKGFITLLIIILMAAACFPLGAFAEKVEIDKTYWIEKSEKNQGIELTVFDYQLKECIGEEEAGPDEGIYHHFYFVAKYYTTCEEGNI